MGTTRRIGIYLFDQAEELDAIGPWEVLANWTRT
jgi:putative intracellular protease/amidase